MRKVKYFLYALICLFSFSIVFAENEVVIKSVTPIYDEQSGVIVTEEESKHKVTFNDKNQSVKYNIVIENAADYDVIINDIVLTTPTEEFLEYELTGAEKEEKLASGETKEIAVTLETVPIEGWGRNFSDDLVAEINFEKVNVPIIDKTEEVVTNPETRDAIILLVLATIVPVSILLYFKKKKISYYILVLGIAGTTIQVVSATSQVILNFNVKANFESQNVMKPAMDSNDKEPVDYWIYREKIKNFYIENKINEITDYEYKFDVSEEQNERVIAYLVTNETDTNYFDLYLQADGIIYPNTDASYYFCRMRYLDKIDNINGFDTSNVTNMAYMFNGTGHNSTSLTLDLGDKFDTSSVTEMGGMFYGAGASSTTFNLDLGEKFDTSNVNNMAWMFAYAGHSSPTFKIDCSNWNVNKVTSYERFNNGVETKVTPPAWVN